MSFFYHNRFNLCFHPYRKRPEIKHGDSHEKWINIPTTHAHKSYTDKLELGCPHPHELGKGTNS